MNRAGVWAVVVAAGRGRRAGLGYNKAFYPLAGRSVLSRCMDALERAGCFEGAVLVLSDGDMERYRALTAREGAPALVRGVAPGGDTRQESVRRGLEALPAQAQIVAIHDAARCFVPPEVVLDTVRLARETGSGVASTPLTDTVKFVEDGARAVSTPARDRLRAVQTPQTFRIDIIRAAHARAAQDGYLATDDAALVERYYGGVCLSQTPGGERNVKLTSAEDIARMEKLLMGTPRVGYGFDAHRMVSGRELILMGEKIPCEAGLLGHSDADVAAHALMDALLGAAGLGDIGRHFPDGDAKYKDACSMLLLGEVTGMLRRKGLRPFNADVTIVAQRPRLAPYMEGMRLNAARAMGLEPEMVNVKATTTEKMGYEGRGEGISASAVALLVRDEQYAEGC